MPNWSAVGHEEDHKVATSQRDALPGDDDSDSDVDVDNPFGEFGIEEDFEDEDVGVVHRGEQKAAATVSGISMDVSAAPQDLECNSSGMDCPISGVDPTPAHASQQRSQGTAEMTTPSDPEQLDQAPAPALHEALASGVEAVGKLSLIHI